MNTIVCIKDNIYWLGKNDRRTALFENYWPLTKGMVYNSYLIIDEKTVLIDTIERSFVSDYLNTLNDLLGDRHVDYLVINHMEPDHSEAIRTIIKENPGITIVGNARTFPILNNFYGDYNKTIQVKDGDSLDLGKRKIEFLLTPMLHWPETMMTLLRDEGIIFSGDAFGAFGTLDGGIFDDQLNIADKESEVRRYFSNIVGKYCIPTQMALKKLKDVKLTHICSTHGHIWRSNIDYILNLYNKWSNYDLDEGVVLAFASMYGHTEKCIDIIARNLSDEGVRNIEIYDTSKTHISYIVSEIFKYKGLILASPVYNAHMFPSMAALMHELTILMPKKHFVSYLGNRSWGLTVLPIFEDFVNKTGMEIVGTPFEVSGEIKDSDYALCKDMATKMKAAIS